MTVNQSVRGLRKVKSHKCSVPALRGCPQKKGQCDKFVIKSPKKPHSARRKTVRVLLYSTRQKIYGYITSMGYGIRKYSNVLLRGGRRRDIPGMKYTLIRGVYDFGPPDGRTTARSKYGLFKPR
jgi:small subunit ribosomal protein S12